MESLLREISRQRDFQSSPESRESDSLGSSELVDIRGQQDGFYDLLQALYNRIRLSESLGGTNANILLPTEISLLWKIPAFCRPTPFVEPKAMILRANAIQTSRSIRSTDKADTEDIWYHQGLEDLVSAKQSRLLLIQGNYSVTKQLERFGLEVTQFLHNNIPTLHLLKCSMTPDPKGLLSHVPASQALRQLAIQALQKISTLPTLSFLARVVEDFRTASSCEDWFQVLQLILIHLAEAYIVLDLGNIARNTAGDVADAHRFPESFRDLIVSLQTKSPSTLLKVVLIHNRPFTTPSDGLISLIRTGLPKATFPPHTRRGLPALKQSLCSKIARTEPNVDLGSHTVQLDLQPCKSRELGGLEISDKLVANQNKDGTSAQDMGMELSSPALDATQGPSRDISTLTTTSSQFTSRQSDDHGNKYTNADANESQKQPISESQTASSQSVTDHTQLKVTVAIMCALTIEADAVEALFDETWEDDSFATNVHTERDTNSYSIGRIGRHNVVLVHMAGMGKKNATLAASNCERSFPDIVLALVVGICGGVPSVTEGSNPEIVLGDVILSEGLVQFDFGRQYHDTFLRKSSNRDELGSPPPVIRALLAKLKGRAGRKGLRERTSHHLAALQSDLENDAVYPGAEKDELFEGNYRHKHSASFGCPVCSESIDSVCETARTASCAKINCDKTKLVPRTRLAQQTGTRPAIHFGLVASGDQVMKSGAHRDVIAAKEEVIAFEMEAAGVWESFPCLVIKGVCDYADSHKNKQWQNYAAATAAACMKAFLEKWTVRV